MINLALLDLVIAFGNLPLHAVQMILYAMEKPTCVLTIFNDFFSFAILTPVFVTLLFITLDTYCGVFFPFFYQHHVTATKVMIGNWALSFILLLLTTVTQILSFWNFYTVAHFVLVIMAIIFFVVVYSHIYKHVTKMHRRVSCVSIASSTSQRNGSEKTMKTSIVIIALFILSFLPSGVYSIFGIAHHNDENVRTYLFPWVQTLRLSSALVNAFIYYWRLGGIRKATINLLPKCCRPAVDYRAKKESYLRKVSI